MFVDTPSFQFAKIDTLYYIPFVSHFEMLCILQKIKDFSNCFGQNVKLTSK